MRIELQDGFGIRFQKQEGLKIKKTDTEDCILLIVSQANYALLEGAAYSIRQERRRRLGALSSHSLMSGNRTPVYSQQEAAVIGSSISPY